MHAALRRVIYLKSEHRLAKCSESFLLFPGPLGRKNRSAWLCLILTRRPCARTLRRLIQIDHHLAVLHL